MLMRSAIEGTLKLIYILEDSTTLQERLKKFAEILSKITSVRDHENAAKVLSCARPGHSEHLKPLHDLLLNDAEIGTIRQNYPHQLRAEIENRWRFTRLIANRTNSALPEANMFPSLIHNYSMASHIQHMDWIGISIPVERDWRSDERRTSVERAHCSRLISDVYSYEFFRLMNIFRIAGRGMKELLEVLSTYQKLSDEMTEETSRWQNIEYPPEHLKP